MFKAWKKRQHLDPDAGVPGLEAYTNEQLFLIVYG